MTLSAVAMLLTYGLLGAFWLWVLAVVTYLLTRKGDTPRDSERMKRIRLSAQLVSSILFVDSVYWFIANGSYYELFPFGWHAHLRNPWLISAIKLAVLISAVLFLLILRNSARALHNEGRNLWFGKIVDLTWDAVGVLDANGRMLFWNRGAERLFGFPREQVTGKHIRDFLVPKDRWSEIDAALLRVRDSKTAVTNYRTQRLKSDGELLWVDISISPIVDDGDFSGYFGIMRAAVGGIPAP